MNKSRKKKILLNSLMAMIIALIVFSGFMIVANNKGWFNRKENTALATDLEGYVSLQRDGISYSINSNTSLRDNDILETKSGSNAKITAGENYFILSENSKVTLTKAQNNSLRVDVDSGEIFFVVEKSDAINEINFSQKVFRPNKSVFSIDVQTGSSNLRVFYGSVSGIGENINERNMICCTAKGEDVSAFLPDSLNDFLVSSCQSIVQNHQLCFSTDELNLVVAKRDAEKQKAQEAQKAHDEKILAQGGTEKTVGTSSKSTTGAKDSKEIYSCTIQIRCDTILKNMEDLKPGKNKYVPKNGIILSTSTVEFVDGETVFDVLNRACKYSGIQLEYSWTPIYSSYYIEGINHLYEFDCGSESGWMYKVNGWFPNYGCSSYKLKNGDTIVWCYTCKGLGVDVGGGVY